MAQASRRGAGFLAGVLKTSYRTKIFLSIIVILLYATVIVRLSNSPPELLSTASIVAESVSIDIVDGMKAAFPVSGMKSDPDLLAPEKNCVEGLITPASGTTVTYSRAGDGPLAIKLRPTVPPAGDAEASIVGSLETGSGQTVPLSGNVYLEASAGCAPLASVQLPIWGQISVGREFRPIAHAGPREPTLLVSGSMKVMARTALFSTRLYLIAETTLPVGSRLEAGPEQSSDHQSNWWGVAYVDLQKPGLNLEIATDARALNIYRPTLTSPDVVYVSPLQQLFSDPNLVWIQLAFGVLIFLLHSCASIADWYHGRKLPAGARNTLSGVALLFLAGIPAGAHADVVRLKMGGNSWGQGWMFLDVDGRCKVVTARHVVEGFGGEPLKVIVIDAHAHELPTDAPILAPNYDIAVLSVPSAADPAKCGNGRLSQVALERIEARVNTMKHAVIRTTGRTESSEIPVERRAASVDPRGGEFFSVRPELEKGHVTAGWSGSVVMDDIGPLGIVVTAAPVNGEVGAVRIDVVRALLSSAAVKQSSPALRAVPPTMAIMSLVGNTLDPVRGPNEIVNKSGGGWVVQPVNGRISFATVLSTPQQIAAVSLWFESSAARHIRGVQVDTQASATGEDWVTGPFCPGPANNAVGLVCRVLLRTVMQVRVTISVDRESEPLTLHGLSLQ